MAESATVNNAQDVVAFLRAQHEQVKQMFEQVATAQGQARRDAFVELRRMLAVHEAAEEEIVHPKARKDLPDGESIVEQRLAEEREAKESLVKLESLDVDSTEFQANFAELRRAVLAHAEAEEREEFAELSSRLDQGQLEKMRRSVELAEKMAPTRPHPGVESAAANVLAGPFVALLDHARDVISGHG